MAWIESHQEVGRHPKTKKLARLLGVSLPAAVGHLHYFWWWALDFAQDGQLEKFDNYDLADAVQWDGDPDTLVSALIASGYIDETDDGLMIHDWGEYAGKLLERRAKDRERKRAAAEAAGVPQSFRRNSNGKSKEAEGTPSASFVTNQPTNHNQPTNSNSTNHNQPTIESLPLLEARFAEFWQAYPKKRGKAACLKLWKKLKPTKELHEQIMRALSWQKDSEQWKREGGSYIPNPLTWLNQGRWEDEPTETDAPVHSSGTLGALAGIIAEEEGGVI